MVEGDLPVIVWDLGGGRRGVFLKSIPNSQGFVDIVLQPFGNLSALLGKKEIIRNVPKSGIMRPIYIPGLPYQIMILLAGENGNRNLIKQIQEFAGINVNDIESEIRAMTIARRSFEQERKRLERMGREHLTDITERKNIVEGNTGTKNKYPHRRMLEEPY